MTILTIKCGKAGLRDVDTDKLGIPQDCWDNLGYVGRGLITSRLSTVLLDVHSAIPDPVEAGLKTDAKLASLYNGELKESAASDPIRTEVRKMVMDDCVEAMTAQFGKDRKEWPEGVFKRVVAKAVEMNYDSLKDEAEATLKRKAEVKSKVAPIDMSAFTA